MEYYFKICSIQDLGDLFTAILTIIQSTYYQNSCYTSDYWDWIGVVLLICNKKNENGNKLKIHGTILVGKPSTGGKQMWNTTYIKL